MFREDFQAVCSDLMIWIVNAELDEEVSDISQMLNILDTPVNSRMA